jgi:Serine/threonine protein kinase
LEEIINEYRLLSPFQSENAGFSKWTFASKNRKNYFIKELLNPVYPEDDSLNEDLKAERIKICLDFEEECKKKYHDINIASDGNLVRISELFRHDSHYYIVMEKVDEAKLSLKEIAKLPYDYKLLLCCNLAHSLMGLEAVHIIHGDIKATNVLLKKTEKEKYIGKVIDFDSAFYESNPPESGDDLVVDQVYISPEALMFVCEEDVKLTCKSDIFSLGVLFHQYFTAELPGFNTEEYDCVAEAILEGDEISISSEIADPVSGIIRSMLSLKPEDRPTMKAVYDSLHKLVVVSKEDTGTFLKSETARAEKAIDSKNEKRTDKNEAVYKNSFFFKPGGLNQTDTKNRIIEETKIQKSESNSIDTETTSNELTDNKINENIVPGSREISNKTSDKIIIGIDDDLQPIKISPENIVKVICNRCGYKNDASSLNCENCGSNL